MKIDDVSLTLFAWNGLPATRYAVQSRVEAGSGVLGLLTLTTETASPVTPFWVRPSIRPTSTPPG